MSEPQKQMLSTN